MKRCPKCSRTFPDDNQKFCTIDGGLLVAGDKPFDPNATIQGSMNRDVPTTSPGEHASNRPDLNETIAASAPTVVFPKQTGPTGLPTSSNLPPQSQSQPTKSSAPPTAAASAPLASMPAKPVTPPVKTAPVPAAQRTPAPPVANVPPVAKKKSKLPLILGILVLLLFLGGGAVVAAFFIVVKPRLPHRNAEPPVVVRENPAENVNNSNSNTNTNLSETKAAPENTEPEYVPPPDTTKFTNSPDNVEGTLADHYFDFSFYYPNGWVADPKAGGASGNFAKFERRLPPDFTQENFAVRYYESKGTYESDLPEFPKLVEDFSASLAKVLPGYHKESEGPTKINSLDAYEFRYVGLSKNTERGDLKLWGRVVFVPTGKAGDTNGAVLTMFTTSLAPELSSVADVGSVGQMPVILDSFRFGKRP